LTVFDSGLRCGSITALPDGAEDNRAIRLSPLSSDQTFVRGVVVEKSAKIVVRGLWFRPFVEETTEVVVLEGRLRAVCE
jgi:hypothetical protein